MRTTIPIHALAIGLALVLVGGEIVTAEMPPPEGRCEESLSLFDGNLSFQVVSSGKSTRSSQMPAVHDMVRSPQDSYLEFIVRNGSAQWKPKPLLK